MPLGPRPILSVDPAAKILLIGQAPGTRVHNSGIPWNDPSGDRLRTWLGVDSAIFYNAAKFSIMPMGFCYPGTGNSGDLPPRPECAPLWHAKVRSLLPNLELTILIGSYAQESYLGKRTRNNLGDTVRAHAEYAPQFIPLVHPSPRNQIWLKKNPWFEVKVVPYLKKRVADLLR